MAKGILDLVGNTPVVELAKINNTRSTILAKLEALNPSGSIKDVMALYMMGVAEKKRLLKPGSTIIEATSGNTGISFAMFAPLKGCKFVAVMPEHMSKERRQMMQAFGAEVVLTPEKEGFVGTLKKVEQIYDTIRKKKVWPVTDFQPDGGKRLRTIFAKAIKETGSKVKAPTAELDAAQTAMDMENKTSDFYRSQGEKATHDAERQFYHTLAGEEREHYLILLDYYEYLKDPAGWFVKKEHPSLDGG